MKIKGKLKSRAGFSLAETLLAVLILLLVSMLMANGIPTVKAVYENVTVGANARVLLSTTVAALRNELGTAKNIVVDNTKKTIMYNSTDTGATSEISLGDAPEVPAIMLCEYAYGAYSYDLVEANTTKAVAVKRRLVAATTATADLYVTFSDIVIENTDRVKIKGLQVMRGTKKADGKSTPVAPIDLEVHLAFGPVREV